MGDLIGQAVSGKLYFIGQEQFKKVEKSDLNKLTKIKIVSTMCRLNTLYMIARAGSGHIGSSFSSMEIFTWLFWNELTTADRFFSSKGHDAPGYYAVMMSKGLLSYELMHQLRRMNGLPGHPDIHTPGIVTNTGSLGMGISKAKGMILANRLNGKTGRIFVVTGDGELQEGQFWESLVSAKNLGLNELTVIIDHNKLQSDTFVKNVSDLGDLKAKLESFGWCVERCNGNDLEQLSSTLEKTKSDPRPKIIIADTVKGFGVSFMEHTSLDSDVEMYKFHSGAPDKQSYQKAAQELISTLNAFVSKTSLSTVEYEVIDMPEVVTSAERVQKMVPAYSKALVELAKKYPNLMALDADLILDTGLIPFKDKFPERFVECGIAEQDMVSMAGGMALTGALPVVHSFSCFLTSRPNEQIYNNATEFTKIIYVGSLAGVVPGGPGHSHQAVRDIASLSGIPRLTMIEPSCEKEVEAALKWAVETNKQSTYLRLTSIPVEIPYEYCASELKQGEGQILKKGTSDVAIMSYGPVMLSQAYQAALDLENSSGLSVTVINMPWLNSVDTIWLSDVLKNTKRLFLIDNHYVHGGQGQFLSSQIVLNNIQVKVYQLGLKEVPCCGQNPEVLKASGLDAATISETITKIL